MTWPNDWSTPDKIRLMPITTAAYHLTAAINERLQAIQMHPYSSSTFGLVPYLTDHETVTYSWFKTHFVDKFEDMLPHFVDRTYNEGNFNGLSNIPVLSVEIIAERLKSAFPTVEFGDNEDALERPECNAGSPISAELVWWYAQALNLMTATLGGKYAFSENNVAAAKGAEESDWADASWESGSWTAYYAPHACGVTYSSRWYSERYHQRRGWSQALFTSLYQDEFNWKPTADYYGKTTTDYDPNSAYNDLIDSWDGEGVYDGPDQVYLIASDIAPIEHEDTQALRWYAYDVLVGNEAAPPNTGGENFDGWAMKPWYGVFKFDDIFSYTETQSEA